MLVTKARGISSDYATWVRSLLGPEGLEISQRDQTIIAKKDLSDRKRIPCCSVPFMLFLRFKGSKPLLQLVRSRLASRTTTPPQNSSNEGRSNHRCSYLRTSPCAQNQNPKLQGNIQSASQGPGLRCERGMSAAQGLSLNAKQVGISTGLYTLLFPLLRF